MPRRLDADAIRHIALTHALVDTLEIPIGRAVSLAQRLMSSSNGTALVGKSLSVSLDIAAFDREIDQRLANAVESVVPARRGRPPVKKRVG